MGKGVLDVLSLLQCSSRIHPQLHVAACMHVPVNTTTFPCKCVPNSGGSNRDILTDLLPTKMEKKDALEKLVRLESSTLTIDQKERAGRRPSKHSAVDGNPTSTLPHIRDGSDVGSPSGTSAGSRWQNMHVCLFHVGNGLYNRSRTPLLEARKKKKRFKMSSRFSFHLCGNETVVSII